MNIGKEKQNGKGWLEKDKKKEKVAKRKFLLLKQKRLEFQTVPQQKISIKATVLTRIKIMRHRRDQLNQ